MGYRPPAPATWQIESCATRTLTLAQNIGQTIAGHHFTGSYIGIVALKVDSTGQVKKFACGQCNELQLDRRIILSLKERHDLILTVKAGKTSILVHGNGDAGDILLRP